MLIAIKFGSIIMFLSLIRSKVSVYSNNYDKYHTHAHLVLSLSLSLSNWKMWLSKLLTDSSSTLVIMLHLRISNNIISFSLLLWKLRKRWTLLRYLIFTVIKTFNYKETINFNSISLVEKEQIVCFDLE